MELWRHKTLRWPIPLAKAVLLQSVLVSASHAVQPTDIAAVDITRLAQLDVTRLALLDLSSYNTGNVAGLDLYLDVTLNGAKAGLAHFDYRDGELWASSITLQQLGFILPAGTIDPVKLSSLANVKINYDARRQTVGIVAPLSLLNLSTTVLNNRTSMRPLPTASPGLLLNYNLYGTHAEYNASSLSAYTELRAFNAFGVLSSTALTTENRAANIGGASSDWKGSSVRLDTSLSMSFPDKLITLSAGDVITGALSWTRSTRLGGLHIGTNFDLQPYLATTPLPSFFGSATLPSAVDLYINGLKQYSGNVPAGPFELNTAPSISGAGNAQLVLTDALGQSTTVNFALYDAHRLLQTGLSDWSVELGSVRQNYGITSFDYGSNVVGSGTWRYGVNDRFTAETHAELTNGLSNAGVGGTWILGSAGGIMFASLAGSESQGQGGTQYSASYSWNNSRFNFGASGMGTQGDYRDVGTQYGSVPTHRSAQVSTGYSTQEWGSFGLSYNEVAYAQQAVTQFANLSWSKSISRRVSLNANYNQDINDSANYSASLGASMSLDRNVSVSASVQRTDDRNTFVADVSQSAPNAGGMGWRAQARHSDGANSSTGALAEVNYLGRYGQVLAGVNDNDGNYSTYASGTGAVVVMGGGVFATRQINSGFAVVSTDGIADVPVLLQNNLIGTTNSKGLLLVTPLNAYQENKIGIDAMNLPADLRIDKVAINATPTDRAGTLVSFGMTPMRSATLVLKDSDGQPIPMGSKVSLSTNIVTWTAIVGFDGEVYMESLNENNLLDVYTPSGEIYTVRFKYEKQGNDIPLIGPLVCEKAQKQ